MAHQITHPTGKPEGLSLAVLRLDAEPVAYLTPAIEDGGQGNFPPATSLGTRT
jgi:hypothetical protein